MQHVLPRFAALCAFGCAAAGASAQFVAVPQIESGFLIRSEPTVVLLRESPSARAVLLTIPGGTGRVGFRTDMAYNPAVEPRTSHAKMFKRLTDPQATSGSFHVVNFDSPYPMPMDATLAARTAKDHLVRIDSVLQFVRERYKLPVWITGHSNGGFSIAEFHRYLQANKRDDQIAGFIFSAGRGISRFGGAANVPALFISPVRDGCHSTSHADNRRLFEAFKAINKGPTDFVALDAGEEEGGDPCTTGVHMYHNAHDEAARAIDAFAVRHMAPQAPSGAR